MIRRSKFLTSILVSVLAFIGFTVAPILALANESAETLENSLESVVYEEIIESAESVEFKAKTYVCQEDGNKIELTMVDEKNAIAEMSIHGVPFATVYMYYEYLTADSISLYATADDSYFGDFNLYADGTMEEISYVYIPEDSEDESAEIFTDKPTEEEGINTVLLPVVSGIVGLVGSGLLCCLLSGRLDKLKTTFTGIVSWFTKKQEELATEEIDLKKIKEDLSAAVCSNDKIKELLQQAYESNKEQYIAFKQAIENTIQTSVQLVGEMKACFDSRADEMQKQYEKIRDILIKMVAGNAELVRQGIADDIIRSFNVEERKKKR